MSMLPIVPNARQMQIMEEKHRISHIWKKLNKNFAKFDSTQNTHITNKLEVERNLPKDKQWKINKAKN